MCDQFEESDQAFRSGKPLIMVCGLWRPKPEAAQAAGVKLTIHYMKESKHAFPESEYPAVRAWLRGPAMEIESSKTRRHP